MFETAESLAQYWEKRAVRFARHRNGLAAVCSFGMPHFYNLGIELCQRRALRRWLGNLHDADVLEVGCGIGRWTAQLAAQGNRVNAIDLSPTMIEETDRRLADRGLHAELEVADVTQFTTGRRFDVVVSVTVIQHITDEREFDGVFRRLAELLRPGGHMILLEAAPSDDNARCDSPIFRARPLRRYQDALTQAGCSVDDIDGVDPMPFKTWVLPYLSRVPRPIAIALANAAMAASLPLDMSLARLLTARSWHKVIVASRRD